MSSEYNLRSFSEIQRALTEQEEKSYFGGEASDSDADFIEGQSDSETEEEFEGVREKASENKKIIIKTETAESPRPNKRGRFDSEDIPLIKQEQNNYQPGPVGIARDCTTPLEARKLLMTERMIDMIVQHTNEEIQRQRSKIDIKQTYHHVISREELEAFIGLLYLSEELWSNEFGTPLFRATMSKSRFIFLSLALRFDDKLLRTERKQSDKFAPIRDLWRMFIDNCQKYYSPNKYCTIDEQLLGFQGPCSFLIHMKSKSDHYGLKIVMLNDARTFYMLNAIPYLGRVETEPNESVSTYFVRTLSTPIHGSNRNLTCDNWFTSMELIQKMLLDYRMTILGAIRKNKSNIPLELKQSGEVGSSKIVCDSETTLVSYTPKRNKIILLLTSLPKATIKNLTNLNVETGKPEIINLYNNTKGGTESFDKLCREYTTARETSRWPVRVFWGILDQSGINAMILYDSNAKNVRKSRRAFLKELSLSLIKPWLEQRILVPTLRRSLKTSILTILKLEQMTEVQHRRLEKHTRCFFCSWRADRKTKNACMSCSKPICDEHRSLLCMVCDGTTVNELS